MGLNLLFEIRYQSLPNFHPVNTAVELFRKNNCGKVFCSEVIKYLIVLFKKHYEGRLYLKNKDYQLARWDLILFCEAVLFAMDR